MARTIKQPARGAKAVSAACCNHGSCHTCRTARLKHAIRDEQRVEDEMREIKEIPLIETDEATGG